MGGAAQGVHPQAPVRGDRAGLGDGHRSRPVRHLALVAAGARADEPHRLREPRGRRGP